MVRAKNFNKYWLFPIAILLAIGIYYLPPVHSRLSWRLDNLRTEIIYFFNPPSAVVFQPSGGNPLTIETVIATTRAEFNLTLTPQPSATPNSGPTAEPTIATTPLPAEVNLPGVIYVDQRGGWNLCGPANLTMALKFWGWSGTRDDVVKVVKPGSGDHTKSFVDQGFADKNVMPYELADFVNNHTKYAALWRYGGDENVIKRMLAAGFPVLIEKGYYEKDYLGKIDWLGHYQFVTGYSDSTQEFIVQDTWNDGPNFHIKYEKFLDGWRSFDYLLMMVYPRDREATVMSLLGPWTDDQWASQHALDLANADIASLAGNKLFFAWFNKGTSHVALQEYVDAANAYDKAFAYYAQWDSTSENPPYRMMWYQTGPYFAYYYSSRYQDVINLANVTLTDPAHKSGRTLEESLLWRGRAYFQTGNTQAAINDYRAALAIHVNWAPAVQALQELGLTP